MTEIKKMQFVFGDITLTLTVDDIEAIYLDWERRHPGKRAFQMKSKEFADACMDRLKANAKLTRTVLHN